MEGVARKLEKRLDRLMPIPRVEPVKTPEEAAPVGKEAPVEMRKTQPMNDHIREIIAKNPQGRGFWSEVQRSMRSGFARLCQVL